MIEESRVNKDLHLVYLEIMNNRLFLIAILINLSVQVFGQDVVPRQAPIDNISSFEDSMKNDEGDSSKFTKIPIIIDSTEGWEWIGKEESEDVFEAYPLRLSYNKYKSHPQYRVIGEEVYNGKGQLVRVVDIFDSDQRSISQRVTDELLRQTYMNYVKKELKLITSSRFYWSKEGVGYLQQLELDHTHDFDILLKIERLNDTSFKLIYGDVKGNSVSTWKVAYLSNGQYKSKIIATRLPLEKIKVRIRVYELKNGKLTIHED